jgi:hypothetical protein
MNNDVLPQPHPDPWIELTRRYVTAAVRALPRAGLEVEHAWLDPRDPRDATIMYSSPANAVPWALVWDEETGWRNGLFESGAQGTRTQLSDVRYLGGRVLPSSADLISRLTGGVSEPRRQYRRAGHLRDGLDDALSIAG